MSPSIKSVLITGGTGSFGQTIVRKMLQNPAVEDVRIVSRDEDKQHHLRLSLQDERVRFYLGDVRDPESLKMPMRGVECVFHAAALKHVPSCEFFPHEAIRTNALGSQNVIREGVKADVRSIVCLSTDKAVNPINAMGMTKALMEKVAQAAARELGPDADTTISCVRYGNVMMSRGSVIPLFIAQIKSGKPLTVTEPSMTRFLMPLRDSVSLVEFAFEQANQGDLFIKKAPATPISVLLDALRDLYERPDHPVSIIGWRHGEKLSETLASAQELQRADDLGEYLRVPIDQRGLNYKPFFSEGDTDTVEFVDFDSHTTDQLNVEETKALLMSLPEVAADVAAWRKNGSAA